MIKMSRAIRCAAIRLQRRGRELRRSSLIRDGIWMSGLNIIAKAANFFGNAFAARCVGAENFGIAGVVSIWAVQSALLFQGGLDAVAAREIAATPKRTDEVVVAVVGFRVSIFFLLAIVWAAVSLWMVPSEHWHVWQLGLVLMLSSALNLIFLFQALNALPIWNMLVAAASLISSVIFFCFSPPMPLGSELCVAAGMNLLATTSSWIVARKKSIIGSINFVYAWREKWNRHIRTLTHLFRTSWRYWLIAIAQYASTGLQFLIVSEHAVGTDVGAYRSAMMLSSTLDVLLSAFYNLLLPRFIAWHKQGDAVFLAQRRKTLILFLLIGTAACGSLIGGSGLIYHHLFGGDFASGQNALILLTIAKGANFLGQIYAYTLIIHRRDAEVMKSCVLGSVASVLIGLTFIPQYGIIAAAVATLVGEGMVTLGYVAFDAIQRRRKQNVVIENQ